MIKVSGGYVKNGPDITPSKQSVVPGLQQFSFYFRCISEIFFDKQDIGIVIVFGKFLNC